MARNARRLLPDEAVLPWQGGTAGYIGRAAELAHVVPMDLKISDPLRDGRSPEDAPGGRTGALA
jgi:hypothetical protein